jgi:hypothetical protein
MIGGIWITIFTDIAHAIVCNAVRRIRRISSYSSNIDEEESASTSTSSSITRLPPLTPLPQSTISYDDDTDDDIITPTTLISIIIPTYNESTNIRATIDAAITGGDTNIEIIIIDGGSTDGTCTIASDAGAHVVLSAPPPPSSSPSRKRPTRASCQNYGAQISTGKILLFLHADTILPQYYTQSIRTAFLSNKTTLMTAFTLSLHPRILGIRLVEYGANLRSHYRQLPYGDQTLGIKRHMFFPLGMFPEQQLLEDLDLVYTAKRRYCCGSTNKDGRIPMQIVTLPECVKSSSRRWMIHGVIGNTIRNQFVLLGHAMGVPLPNIASWYYKDGLKEY